LQASSKSWADNPKSAEIIKKTNPDGLMIVVPKTGWFWKVISYAVTIVTFGGQRPKIFMEDYATTFVDIVAVPPSWTIGQLERVLPHEHRHVEQAKMCGLGLHAWVGIWVYAILYCLVFFPIGIAYFRYRFECDAERDKYRYLLANGGSESDLRRRADRFSETLSSGAYFWCWPKKWVSKRLHKYVDEVLKESRDETRKHI
jgi:hypothetical protein